MKAKVLQSAEKSLLVEKLYFAPSDKLRKVKEFIQKLPELKAAFGEIMEFRLVVDTSIVLADIRWLAKNQMDKSVRTGLMEIIDAGIADVFAPRKLVMEVEKHLPRIALQAGVTVVELRDKWSAYKTRLRIHDVKLGERHLNTIDPEDTEFIVLAQRMGAHGVLTKDRHIKQMGGRALELDFILSVRDYSRATAIEFNITFMGLQLGVLTLAMGSALIELIRGLIGGIAKLPDWAKLLLLSGAVFAVLHPPTKAKIKKGYENLISGWNEISPMIFAQIGNASMIAQQHKQIAVKHLATAKHEIEKYGPQIKTIKRRHRMKRKSI